MTTPANWPEEAKRLRRVLEPAESARIQPYQVDIIGRAIHAAKTIGGPWGPPCAVATGWNADTRMPVLFRPVEYGYDSGEFECECRSMAAHLLELMESES